jgi:transposase
MMGRQRADQAQFFYSFHLEERVPASHLLRRINVFVSKALADVHREMAAFYSHTGRPSIDPELMMRMLIVGYCYGIRSERKLCEEVSLNLAYRWFCRLDLIIRPSRRTVMAAFARAICCAWCSSAWWAFALLRD